MSNNKLKRAFAKKIKNKKKEKKRKEIFLRPK